MKHLKVFLFLLLALTLALPAQTQRTVSITATIANGTAGTGSIALGSCFPTGVLMPTTWTAASILVKASLDGTNFYPVYDQYGTMLILTAADSRWIVFNPPDTWGFRFMQLRSVNSSGVDSNQAGTRSLKVICR
jgi:hypothetical protein